MWNLCRQHMRKTSQGVPYLWPERPERQMGTQGVHMKGVLPWLVPWSCCTGIRYFYIALDAQVSPIQNIFSSMHKFHFICPYRPASWACRRAVSPVFLIFISVSVGDPDVMCTIWKHLCSSIGHPSEVNRIEVPWTNFMMFSEGFLRSSLKWSKNYSGFVWFSTTFVIKRYEACSLSA